MAITRDIAMFMINLGPLPDLECPGQCCANFNDDSGSIFISENWKLIAVLTAMTFKLKVIYCSSVSFALELLKRKCKPSIT